MTTSETDVGDDVAGGFCITCGSDSACSPLARDTCPNNPANQTKAGPEQFLGTFTPDGKT